MKKKKKNKPGAGRKWFNGRNEEAVVAQLCEVWGIAGSDAEAAYYADIEPSTLSRYLEAHPEIKQRKAALLNRPILLARKAVIGSFDGHITDTVEVTDKKGNKKKMTMLAPVNPAMAMSFLEKRAAKEFSPSVSVHHSGEIGTGNQIGKDIAACPAASAAAAKMVEALSMGKKVNTDGADPAP